MGSKHAGLFPRNVNQIYYKKCFGKNYYFSTRGRSESNTEHIDNNFNNLNLKEISDMVGIVTVDKFYNVHNVVETENRSEDFFILYRAYEKLKKRY